MTIGIENTITYSHFTFSLITTKKYLISLKTLPAIINIIINTPIKKHNCFKKLLSIFII